MLPLDPTELAGVWVTVDLDAADAAARIRSLEAAEVDGVRTRCAESDLRAWAAAQRRAERLCTELELPWRVVLGGSPVGGPESDTTELRGRLDAARAVEPAAFDVGLAEFLALGALGRTAAEGVAGFVVDVGRAIVDPRELRSIAREADVTALRFPRLDEESLDEVRAELNEGSVAVSTPAIELVSARRLGATLVDDGLSIPAPESVVAWWCALDEVDRLGSPRATAHERTLLRWIEGELQPAARRAGLSADIGCWGRVEWTTLARQGVDLARLRSRIEPGLSA